MMNFGALNWFDSFIKKLKKGLDCMNHMIYTYVIAIRIKTRCCRMKNVSRFLIPFQGNSHNFLRGGVGWDLAFQPYPILLLKKIPLP